MLKISRTFRVNVCYSVTEFCSAIKHTSWIQMPIVQICLLLTFFLILWLCVEIIVDMHNLENFIFPLQRRTKQKIVTYLTTVNKGPSAGAKPRAALRQVLFSQGGPEKNPASEVFCCVLLITLHGDMLRHRLRIPLTTKHSNTQNKTTAAHIEFCSVGITWNVTSYCTHSQYLLRVISLIFFLSLTWTTSQQQGQLGMLKQDLETFAVPLNLKWRWKEESQGTTLENNWTDIVDSHSVRKTLLINILSFSQFE